MYLIVGLGNPEDDYSKTRHNMGFNVINKIAKQYNIEVNKNKFKGLIGKGKIEGIDVILLKPQTYMNLSGESIKEVVDFYKIELDKLLIIYDDMDVDIEQKKKKKKGGAGSHNGMKSVIDCINTEEFSRIRVGIGKPEDKSDMINYVLGYIPENEVKELDKSTTIAKDAIIDFILNGIDNTMNKYN